MSGMPVERNASRARPSQGGGSDSGLGALVLRQRVHCGGQAREEGARKVGAPFPDRALADQHVGNDADDGQHRREQQPRKRTARRVPAQDDAHADAGHDRDVQRDQGNGFEMLRRHDCGCRLSSPRPSTRPVSERRSS